MSNRTRVWIAGAGVILLLSGLGCSVCPLIPDGATPTPTRPTAPTRTPTRDAGEMELLSDPRSGISLLYPEGWVYESEGGTVFLAQSHDALMDGDPAETPVFAAVSLLPEDLAGPGGLDEPQDMIDAVIAQMMADEGGCDLSDAEATYFGDTPGARAEGPCTDPPIYLLVGAAYSDNVAGMAIAAAPVDEWEEHRAILEAIFDSVEFSPPQAPESVDMGTIAPGQTVEATLERNGIHSWYFDAERGTYATIDLSAADRNELDTYLDLYDEDGQLLDSDDDGGDGTDSLIMLYPIPAAGTYQIQVSAFSGDGDYSLSLTIVADIPEGGGPIAYGDVFTATLVSGAAHEWTFDGQQGDQVTIAMLDLAGDIDPYLELYGPDDQYLADDDDGGWSLDSLIDFYELPEAGTYTIICSGLGDSTGLYQLSLGLGEYDLLQIGDSVAATLDPGERHSWLFEGTEGDSVTVSLVALDEDLDPFLQLFGPGGDELTSDDDGGEGWNSLIDRFELPESGTYRIVARCLYRDEGGDYELTLSSP
jgi:hypothetical protein